jgi:hypothetical protein
LSSALRSNAGMANRQGDVDLRFAPSLRPELELWLGLAGLENEHWKICIQLHYDTSIYIMTLIFSSVMMLIKITAVSEERNE